MKAIFSTESVDAAKHIMKMGGVDLSRFNDNPVLLFVHNDEAMPVGTIKNLRVENSQLVGEVVWDEKDPEALKIKGKYERGIMRGFSIRATIKKSHKVGNVRVIEEWELIEISCVAVPANKDCLVVEKSIKSKVEGSDEEIELPDVVRVDFFSNQFSKSILNMEQVFKKLGIVAAEQQTEDEVMKKIGNLEKRASDAEADVKKKESQIEALNDEISTLKEDAETQKINDLVDGAVTKKKIMAGEAESFKKLAKTSFDTVKSLLDSKQGVESPSEQIRSEETSDVVLKTYNEHKDKGYDYFFKKEPKVLESLKKSYPDKFAELQKTIKAS